MGVDLEPVVLNKLMVDAVIEDFDKLNYEFANKGRDVDFQMSRSDIEKTFNYYCYKILQEQTDHEARISNIARSWSPLKSAIRVWLRRVLSSDNFYNYKVFINDVNKGPSSVFRPAITKAIKDYKPILENILAEESKKIEEENSPIFTIQDTYGFSDQYVKEEAKLCALDKYYVLKGNYLGKKNERLFKEYIDSKDSIVEWWFKNGNHGKEYFAIKYFNTKQEKYRLFYPDWIVKFKNGKVGIFDTKSGMTLEAEGRDVALSKKLLELGSSYFGGIVTLKNGIWYCKIMTDIFKEKFKWVELEVLLKDNI